MQKTPGERLADYRQLLTEIDETTSKLNALKMEKAEQQDELMDVLGELGLNELKGEGITIKKTEKLFARIDGDWEDIQKSLIEQGYGYLVQKRVTASKLEDAMCAGLRLPDGLDLDGVETISHYRK